MSTITLKSPSSFQILRRFAMLSKQDAAALWQYSELLLSGPADVREQIHSSLKIYKMF